MPISLEDIAGINYSSINNAGTGFRDLNPTAADIGFAATEALNLSYTRGYRLTRGIISTVNDEVQYEEDVGNLISWARAAGSQERQIVAKAIRNDGGRSGNLYLVHNISSMPQTEARAFMQDYLDAGGDTKAISDWLSIAGRVLRESQGKTSGTAGFVVDAVEWVVGAIEDVVDSIVEAIEAIVDAIITAGRALVDIVGDVITWTIEAVGDLAEALLEVGQSIGDILAAAWEFSVEAVTKFVRALRDIGREIGELILWAINEAVDALETVMRAIVDTVGMIADAIVWAVTQTIEIVGQVVQTLIDIGREVVQILGAIINMAANVIVSVIEAMIEIGITVAELVAVAITRPGDFLNAVVQALIDIGQTIAELFNEVVDIVGDGVRRIAESLHDIGVSVIDLVAWAIDKTGEIIKDVIRGIIDAGTLVVDLLAELISSSLDTLKKVVQALFDIGRTILDLVEDVIVHGIDFTRNFFTAITEMVGGLIRFAQEVVRLSYSAAALLVQTLLDVGLTIAELVGTVVGASYWVFRRIINGIIEATGPVGEILDFILTQVENTVDELWTDTLMAIRFAGGAIEDAIEWAANVSDEAFEGILVAWEEIGENLIDFYEFAADLATAGVEGIFEQIGRATVRIENSVTYILQYLSADFIPGIRDFIKGAMEAGYVLATLMVNVTTITLTALTEVVGALWDIGFTLADMLVAIMQDPDNILETWLQTLDSINQTLVDLFQAAIIETGEAYLEEVVNALFDLEEPLRDMLEAVLEVSTGALGTVISLLLLNLSSYRAMTEAEIDEARLVFGDTLDYSRIFFSQESLLNEIIFQIQDFFDGNENSQAFVTNSLVNFDINDGPIDNATIIHELTHVWQFEDAGPFYMAEAIHAQVWGDGWNYGATNDVNGDGGEDDLLAAMNDNPGLSNLELLLLFNREQQGMILEHYYVRRHDEMRPEADWATWLPFRQAVFS